VRDYEGHVYIGTSSWILCHVPFKKTDIFHIIASLPSSIPGRYFCANEQDTAGGCLTFLLDNLVFHRNELRAGTAPHDVYGRLDRLVASVPAGSKGVLFTPAAMATGYFTWWLNYLAKPMRPVTIKIRFSILLWVFSILAFLCRLLNPEILLSFGGWSILYLLLVFSLIPIVTVVGWFGAALTFPLGEK
jgi:hypothetical protein